MYFCNYTRLCNYTVSRWYQTERPYNQQCQRVKPGTVVLSSYTCFFYYGFLSIEPNEVKLPKTLSLRCTLLPFLPKKEMTSIAWISQQWKRPHQLIGGYSGLTVALLIVTLKALISFINPLMGWTWELDLVRLSFEGHLCFIHLIFLCINIFILVLSHDM